MKKLLRAGVSALLLTACFFYSAWAGEGEDCMVIRQYPAQLELARYRLAGAEGFDLTFIHSVSSTPVRDEYRLDGRAIVQTAEIFKAHGAGLPSDTLDQGAIAWRHEGGEFILTMERPIPYLIVRTDRRYRNRLQIGARQIDLNQWDDQALLMSVEACQPRLDTK